MIPSDWWRTFFAGSAVEMWLSATPPEMTTAEVDFLDRILLLHPGSRVLDVPCGGGRHAVELTARGRSVTAVDLSSDFLTAARGLAAQRNVAVDFHEREMRDLPWTQDFDAAYCFGNSFGYLDDAGNDEFLHAVARTLKPGGRFALDSGYIAECLFPNFTERRWMQIGDILFLSHGQYDPPTGRLNTEYRFLKNGRGEPQQISARIYTYSELVRLLTNAGFDGIQAWSSLSQEPFRLGSPRLLVGATKK
jgi:SAM-dependent methyltransferase